LGRPQASFVKRQREQARREKAAAKAEKRAQRGTGGADDDIDMSELVRETPVAPDDVPSTK
jgi:hypothetical protein